MSQYRDLRAPCRMYVLVGTVVSPIAFAKRPTYMCSALPATVTLASEADTRPRTAMRRECDKPHQAAPFCTVSRQVQQAGSLIANGIKLRRGELHVAVFVNPATQRKSAGER